jgi:DNA invertase Pin-like site-specific DNA recombinase
VVVAWALDDLARSVRNPMDTLQDLESTSVELFLHQ